MDGDIDITVYIRGLGTDTQVSEVSSDLFLLQQAHFHAVTIWVTSCLLKRGWIFKKSDFKKTLPPLHKKCIWKERLNICFALINKETWKYLKHVF